MTGVPAVPDGSHGETGRVGVVGAGSMGAGIAYAFAAGGYLITLVDSDAVQTRRALKTIRAQAERAADRGRLAPSIAAELAHRVRPAGSVDDLPLGLDLVVEAVPERLDLKRAILTSAEARHPLLLASNTSGLSIKALSRSLRRPADFLGLHFFNPVWSMPLVEIVRGPDTGVAALDRARTAAARIGKETILVRDAPGFATSRLGVAIGLEAMRMLEEGVAAAADIDRAMELGYRHPMGPLRLSDLVGLDVRLDIARHLTETYGQRFEPPAVLVDKVAAGELGRKSGKGFYDWPA